MNRRTSPLHHPPMESKQCEGGGSPTNSLDDPEVVTAPRRRSSSYFFGPLQGALTRSLQDEDIDDGGGSDDSTPPAGNVAATAATSSSSPLALAPAASRSIGTLTSLAVSSTAAMTTHASASDYSSILLKDAAADREFSEGMSLYFLCFDAEARRRLSRVIEVRQAIEKDMAAGLLFKDDVCRRRHKRQLKHARLCLRGIAAAAAASRGDGDTDNDDNDDDENDAVAAKTTDDLSERSAEAGADARHGGGRGQSPSYLKGQGEDTERELKSLESRQLSILSLGIEHVAAAATDEKKQPQLLEQEDQQQELPLHDCTPATSDDNDDLALRMAHSPKRRQGSSSTQLRQNLGEGRSSNQESYIHHHQITLTAAMASTAAASAAASSFADAAAAMATASERAADAAAAAAASTAASTAASHVDLKNMVPAPSERVVNATAATSSTAPSNVDLEKMGLHQDELGYWYAPPPQASTAEHLCYPFSDAPVSGDNDETHDQKLNATSADADDDDAVCRAASTDAVESSAAAADRSIQLPGEVVCRLPPGTPRYYAKEAIADAAAADTPDAEDFHSRMGTAVASALGVGNSGNDRNEKEDDKSSVSDLLWDSMSSFGHLGQSWAHSSIKTDKSTPSTLPPSELANKERKRFSMLAKLRSSSDKDAEGKAKDWSPPPLHARVAAALRQAQMQRQRCLQVMEALSSCGTGGQLSHMAAMEAAAAGQREAEGRGRGKGEEGRGGDGDDGNGGDGEVSKDRTWGGARLPRAA